jgi:osmotically-inducible protein OsmY
MRFLTVIIAFVAGFGFCAGRTSVAGTTLSSSDQTITSWVQDALHQDPRIDMSQIHVRTDGGIVKLTGRVGSLAGRMYADLEAKKIQGVRGVVNEIEVLPVLLLKVWNGKGPVDQSRAVPIVRVLTDLEITRALQSRLQDSVMLRPRHLRVKVVDGTATLTGEVASYAQRRDADLLAAEQPGVRRVVNGLTVDKQLPRPNDDIRRDVQAAIGRDVYLTGLPLTVRVVDGTVTLSGIVGNPYEKQRAEERASAVANVRDVKNEIAVQPREDRGVRSLPPSVPDAQLERAVLSELREDHRMAATPIVVRANQGNVTLLGSVATYREHGLAEQDAHDVVGVHGVTNLIRIVGKHQGDLALEQSLRSAFDRDLFLTGQDIQIRVHDGVVILTGTINRLFEKSHATDLASGAFGAQRVINDLKLNASPKYGDRELEKRITDRLAANYYTRWALGRIHVSVVAGKAYLTGGPVFQSERKEVELVVGLTDGIRDVDDSLELVEVSPP